MHDKQTGLVKEVVLIVIALLIAHLYFGIDVYGWVGGLLEHEWIQIVIDFINKWAIDPVVKLFKG